MIKKFLCILTSSAFMSSVFAADHNNSWIDVWKHKKGEAKFQVKLGSFESFPNMAQSNTYSILSRWVYKDGRISFLKYSITDEDCKQGYGKLTGNPLGTLDYEDDAYVKNGGNGVSLIGDLLCDMGSIKSK